MKKNYIEPTFRLHKLRVQGILAGSPDGSEEENLAGGGEDEHPTGVGGDSGNTGTEGGFVDGAKSGWMEW